MADSALIAEINVAIQAGKAQSLNGNPIRQNLDHGLINADRSLLYPIFNEIPTLVSDAAIDLVPYQKEPSASP